MSNDDASASGPPPPIRRERTAMHRVTCSRPVALALQDGIVTRKTSFFDYGCGRGADVRILRARGVDARGWDPHFKPRQPLVEADVVNLGFVLNVIEDATERAEALQRAFALARHALVVAVRVDRVADVYAEYGDGHLTAKNTFQKLYTQSEFREYVESVLGRPTHAASLGVAYVFKTDEAAARFLANRAFARRLEYRADLVEHFAKHTTARRYVQLANRLGRAPLPVEFPDYAKLLDAFGSPQQVHRLLLRSIDRAAFDGSRAQRREDVLTFLAVLRLQGVRTPPLGAMPATVQHDIKALWPNFAAAVKEGEAFLFSMGSPDVVRAACASAGIGKRLPSDLYVHRSAEDELPALLRVVLFAARRVVGTLTYDLAKIAVDGRAVSFLTYDDFDGVAHPALLRSVRVYLPRASYDIREYTGGTNPPVLHRKETFVGEHYPHRLRFAALTAAEDAAGLLSAPDIGFREQWEALLRTKGYAIRDHELVASAPA